MLRGQGVRCLASLHCFIKYQSIRWREYTIIHDSIFSFKALISGGSRGGPPLCLHQTEVWRAEKKNLGETPHPLLYPRVWMNRLDLPLLILLASIWGDPWTLSLEMLLIDYLVMNLPNSTQTSNVKLTETELVVCPGFAVRVPVFLVRPRHKCLPSFCFQTHGQFPLHIEQAHVPQVYSRNHREGSMIFMVFL